MAVFNVNIYIETSIKGPKVGMAAGAWWVECITKKPEPEFRRGWLWKQETTENALALELLRDALGILLKTCSVRVNTQCGLVLNAMEKGWVRLWEADGWVNAKGRPVKHAELWQQVYEKMGKHVVGFGSWENPHREEMLEGMQIVLGSRGQVDPWGKGKG